MGCTIFSTLFLKIPGCVRTGATVITNHINVGCGNSNVSNKFASNKDSKVTLNSPVDWRAKYAEQVASETAVLKMKVEADIKIQEEKQRLDTLEREARLAAEVLERNARLEAEKADRADRLRAEEKNTKILEMMLALVQTNN